MTRWLVETPFGPEDVGHAYVNFLEGGVLGFQDAAFGPIVFAYAAGRWYTVTRKSEDD